jgi:SAM-dependent methyltransferase
VPQQRETKVARALENETLVRIASQLPVPLGLVRPILRRNDADENRRGNWKRLRAAEEFPRYAAVAMLIEKYAPDGFILDVGCSQGILQERVGYARYLGIDTSAAAIARASAKTDDRTSFQVADASRYQPQQPVDAVVLNEVVYYLSQPLATVHRYGRYLAAGGVLILCNVDCWATRRLRRRLATGLRCVDSVDVRGESGLIWTAAVFRSSSPAREAAVHDQVDAGAEAGRVAE